MRPRRSTATSSSRPAGARGRIRPLLVCLALLASLACRQEPPLPTLWPAPRFALTDQQGQPFGTADVGQRVALANFVYTSCTDTCPLLSATMGQIQEQLKSEGLFGGKVVLLSFSLDPERDTPPVLAAYGERFGADPAAWKLLTGPSDTLGQLAQDFKLGRPIPLPPSSQNPLINLAHSNRFVLIDGSGQVRATYLGDSLEVADVVRDIKRLLR
jgi:protein SCO1/2